MDCTILWLLSVVKKAADGKMKIQLLKVHMWSFEFFGPESKPDMTLGGGGAIFDFFFFFISIFARISMFEHFRDGWASEHTRNQCLVVRYPEFFLNKPSPWSYKIRSLTVFRNSHHFQNWKFFLIIVMYLSCISRENYLLVE